MKKAIILSAGEGTRMKSHNSKVLHKLLNKPMIDYVMDACDFVDQKIVVGGNNYDILRENLDESIHLVKQNIGENYPYGTGYAVKLCLDEINDDDKVIILTGDTPLIKQETLKKFFDYHEQQNSVATVLTSEIDDPFGYGRIVKDENGNLLKIVEQKDCNDQQLLIKEFNSGMMIVNGDVLKMSIEKIDTNNSKGEMYLTDIFEIIRKDGKIIKTFKHSDVNETYGINTKAQLYFCEEILKQRVNEKFMEDGVVISNSDSVIIEPSVKIGRDTVIIGPCRIYGSTEIGCDCLIKGDCEIVDSKISDNVVIKSSYIENSVVGKNTDIGPFAHLRPNSVLKENVHIGNFVEVKNANVDDGTKAGHLAYIGDCDLGKDINIGCGVIFVNYDGKFKHRSKIEDSAFIGSNSNIVAPVHVKKEGYIAAGSTITKDVDEGVLSIERAEQKNIPGYVEKKKKRDLEKLKEQK